MEKNNFIELIIKKYQVDQYDVSEIKDWIDEQSLSDKDLEDLWQYIIRQFKYKVLRMFHLLEIWEENKPYKTEFRGTEEEELLRHNKNIESLWDRMSVKKILHIIKDIRKKKCDYDSQESSFLARYGELKYEYDLLMEKKEEKGLSADYVLHHLEYVKENIMSGRKYLSIREKFDYYEHNAPVTEFKNTMSYIHD